MFCSKCGSNVADGIAFCPICGAKIEAQVVAPQQIAPQQIAPQPGMPFMQESPKNKKSKAPFITVGVVVAAIAVFLVIAFTTGMFGKKNSEILGKWYYDDNPNSYFIISEQSVEIYEYGSLYGSFSVDEINDEEIILVNPYGGKNQTMPYEIKGNKLYLKNGQGSERIFVREY